MPTSQTRLSYNVEEALAATGLNRNALYRAIAAGQLQTFKVGKRRMVSVRSAGIHRAKGERSRPGRLTGRKHRVRT